MGPLNFLQTALRYSSNERSQNNCDLATPAYIRKLYLPVARKHSTYTNVMHDKYSTCKHEHSTCPCQIVTAQIAEMPNRDVCAFLSVFFLEFVPYALQKTCFSHLVSEPSLVAATQPDTADCFETTTDSSLCIVLAPSPPGKCDQCPNTLAASYRTNVKMISSYVTTMIATMTS